MWGGRQGLKKAAEESFRGLLVGFLETAFSDYSVRVHNGLIMTKKASERQREPAGGGGYWWASFSDYSGPSPQWLNTDLTTA